MTWSWSKAPAVKQVDIPAISTSESFAFYSGSGKATYYWHGKLKDSHTEKSLNIQTKNDGKGAYAHNMQMQKWYSSPKKGNYVPLKGELNITWKKSGNINFTGVSANYGHTTIKIVPNVSFKDAGISYSLGVSSGPDAYAPISR